MTHKPRKCPLCKDGGSVDDKLQCSQCGNQLAYVSEEGTLAVDNPLYRCPRCHTENSPNTLYCQDCGTQLAIDCPLCKGKHPAGARVCGKYGEPLGAKPSIHHGVGTIIRESYNLLIHRYRKGLVVPLVLLALMGGYLTYTKITARTITPLPFTGKPSIDVVFCVDSTGSMADEIQVIQEKIKDMAARIKSGQPVPYVRFGLVTYRDRGDDYIVKKWDFTDNINKFQSNVNTLVADGGGDTKEAVNEALHASINELSWDGSQSTRKLLFLIGDAGPHTDYNNGLDYHDECVAARKKGIKLYTLGCSGIEEDGDPEFREIAEATGGTFDYLTYRQQFVDDKGATFYRYKAGKDYYEINAKGDEWRDGVKSAVERGMAKEAPAPSAAPGGSGGIVMFGEVRAQQKAMENNLDTVFTNTVQKDAESMGIRYRKK
jgi:Mg-chelatase subunit ChlD